MEDLRPVNWKPDRGVQQQIEEKLQKNTCLHEIVNWICQQVLSKKKNQPSVVDNTQQLNPTDFTVSVFNSKLSDYQLHNSIILDSRASLHVCNNWSCFWTFNSVTEESFVYAGNTVIPFEGFEHVTVMIQTPTGLRKIELLDAAYILSFYTTVASLEKFVSKDVH